ncbi:phage portal protein [Marinifilum sp. N1E240]|uniref:phage portal protein n=1 Tax=Marinifilum sp. N1E240 TaxID=2608082 RepID=UPI00128E760F|nr:phage portal protein [Marinifilum sp. N1E240]MPQ46896.1 phage portal protein [Marinifilum sp. N1E240]
MQLVNINYSQEQKSQQKIRSEPTSTGASFSTISGFEGILGGGDNTNLPAAYACILAIANGVSTCPIKVFEITDEGKVHRPNHRVQKVLNNPNKLHTRNEVMRQFIWNSLTGNGNGYLMLKKDNYGVLEEIIPIKNQYVRVIPNNQFIPSDVEYDVNGYGVIESPSMAHIWENTDNGYEGTPLNAYAADTLEIANHSENTAKKFFKNGANFSAVINLKGRTTENRIKDTRNSVASALSDGGGLVFTQGESMDIKPISVDPKNSQLLESRAYNDLNVARYYGVIPQKINAGKISYNTLEAAQLAFTSESLEPRFDKVEQELNRKLFTQKEVGKFIVEFDRTANILGDMKSRIEYWYKAIMCGISTPANAAKNLNIPTSEEANQYVVVGGMTPLSMLDEIARNQIDNRIQSTEEEDKPKEPDIVENE